MWRRTKGALTKHDMAMTRALIAFPSIVLASLLAYLQSKMTTRLFETSIASLRFTQ